MTVEVIRFLTLIGHTRTERHPALQLQHPSYDCYLGSEAVVAALFPSLGLVNTHSTDISRGKTEMHKKKSLREIICTCIQAKGVLAAGVVAYHAKWLSLALASHWALACVPATPLPIQLVPCLWTGKITKDGLSAWPPALMWEIWEKLPASA